jgi:hypothetical protein
MKSLRTQVLLCTLLVLAGMAPLTAGGPNFVAGPSTGNAGQIITWPQNQVIHYRIDGGPLSSHNGTVVVSGAQAATRVQSLFQAWQNVPTANLNIQSSGSVLSVPASGSSPGFSDGDVNTAAEFDAVLRSCDNGTQSPILFDADGSITEDLGLPPEVIGFTGICKISGTNFVTGFSTLNGRFIDGINAPPNYELPSDGFDATFIHEFGHFLGLDHSQINLQCLYGCGQDDFAGLPTMFPVLMTVEQKTLSTDDMSWITTLYPKSNVMTTYGKITGTVYFYDGISQVQGANVIVRAVDDPLTAPNESLRVAVSVVSGFKFTGNPGQSVTGNNPGSSFGSRDPATVGYYEVLVPPGKYTVQVESVFGGFGGGSSVGPLDPAIQIPGPDESWHQGQSNNDYNVPAEPITVAAGQTVSDINFILNTNYARSDQWEDTSSLKFPPDILGKKDDEEGGVA